MHQDLLLKTQLNYSDKLENLFAIRLFKEIKKYCKIECDFNNDQFCAVDYKITERNNPNNYIYLELKSRDKKYLKNKQMIIGHPKMVRIDKCGFNECILVWNFEGPIYFYRYHTGLILSNQKIIRNGAVIEIDKLDCDRGMKKLVFEIYEMLNIIN